MMPPDDTLIHPTKHGYANTSLFGLNTEQVWKSPPNSLFIIVVLIQANSIYTICSHHRTFFRWENSLVHNCGVRGVPSGRIIQHFLLKKFVSTPFFALSNSSKGSYGKLDYKNLGNYGTCYWSTLGKTKQTTETTKYEKGIQNRSVFSTNTLQQHLNAASGITTCFCFPAE